MLEEYDSDNAINNQMKEFTKDKKVSRPGGMPWLCLCGNETVVSVQSVCRYAAVFVHPAESKQKQTGGEGVEVRQALSKD